MDAQYARSGRGRVSRGVDSGEVAVGVHRFECGGWIVTSLSNRGSWRGKPIFTCQRRDAMLHRPMLELE
jgi:hypothetical protein